MAGTDETATCIDREDEVSSRPGAVVCGPDDTPILRKRAPSGGELNQSRDTPPDGTVPMSDETRDQRIARLLREKMQAAREEHEHAIRAFDSVATGIPSGLPFPDGVIRIQQAGAASLRALEQYRAASRRYHEYIRYGIVPIDFL